MNALCLCLAFSGALLFLQSCGADTPPAQRAHPTDSASLEVVQEQVLAQLHNDPVVGNVGHDFVHLLAIYQRSMRAGAIVELRTGQDPALRKVAAAVRDQAQQIGAEADRLAQVLHGRALDYQPDDVNDPFTRGVRASLQVSFRAHAAANLPDHDFAALLLGQRQSEAVIARAALNTGRLPGPAQGLARRVLVAHPTETRLLRTVLSRPHAQR